MIKNMRPEMALRCRTSSKIYRAVELDKAVTETALSHLREHSVVQHTKERIDYDVNRDSTAAS